MIDIAPFIEEEQERVAELAAKKAEEKTVFILCCDGRYALEKRPGKGLLAGLWQFPNTSGRLETQQALEYVEALGLRPRGILRQTERSHIFTHIRWDMRGVYLEVAERGAGFHWLTAEEIRKMGIERIPMQS